MLKVEQIFENVKITELSYEGYGIFKSQNKTILIKNVLPNEIVDIKITKVTSKVAYAKVIKFHLRSKERTNLDYQDDAPLLIMPYQRQLEFKQGIISNLVKRNLNFKLDNFIVPSPLIIKYRNKIKFFVKVLNNQINFGRYEKLTNKLVLVSDFILATDGINRSIQIIKNIFNDWLSLFSSVEEITIRESNLNGAQILIIKSKKHLNLNKTKNLIFNNTKIEQIVCVSKNKVEIYNKFGSHANLLMNIENLKFEISWNSFFQINNSQIFNLYNLLIENLNLNQNQSLLDLYCGVGTISSFLALKTKKVIGLEIIPEAVQFAKNNATLNQINNLFFFAGDVEKTIKFVKNDVQSIVVDPPREGLSEQTIKSIIDFKPKQIGYISCNPHTFVRDAKILLNHNYRISFMQSVDMFPNTYHIELVAVFCQKEEKK